MYYVYRGENSAYYSAYCSLRELDEIVLQAEEGMIEPGTLTVTDNHGEVMFERVFSDPLS
jgi:hypothetical protein